MAYIKGTMISKRVKTNLGLDFTLRGSNVGAENGDTTKADIVFHSGATLGNNPGVAGEYEKGILLTETLTAGTYTTEWKGKYASAFKILVDTTNSYDGHSMGAVNISMNRTTDQTPGGSPDTALRIDCTGYSSTTGGNRGIDVVAYCRSLTSNCQGILATARLRSGSSLAANGLMYGGKFTTKLQTGTAAGSASAMNALVACDESDGAGIPDQNSIVFIEKQTNSYLKATRAAIEIVNNANTTYAKVITNGIYFKSGASGSNITNAFGFDSTDGTDGATAYAGTITGSGNCIRITVLVGNTTYYVLGYATVDH